MRNGRGEAYVVEAYRHWFEAGEPAGAERNLSDSLSSVGANPDAVIEKARSAASGEALEGETPEAERLGIFGAPTFVVDNEVFWGDDRLEDTLEWHRCGRLG